MVHITRFWIQPWRVSSVIKVEDFLRLVLNHSGLENHFRLTHHVHSPCSHYSSTDRQTQGTAHKLNRAEHNQTTNRINTNTCAHTFFQSGSLLRFLSSSSSSTKDILNYRMYFYMLHWLIQTSQCWLRMITSCQPQLRYIPPPPSPHLPLFPAHLSSAFSIS